MEEILDAHREALGAVLGAYRGHVYRVLNYARAYLGHDRSDDVLAVASAFHDLGIWTDRTFDYLPPSVARAREHVRSKVPGVSEALVVDAIDRHHVLARTSGPEETEAFRKADRVDVSLGLVRSGLDIGLVRELVAAFPYAGFHGVLVRTALGWFVRHPLRPLPMLRLR